MKALVLQHVFFEDIGYIKEWFAQHNATVEYVRFFQENINFPKLESIDFLIVMGGPMSVNDEHLFGWLVQEKEYIKQAIENNIPVLGICLGAQLIVSALGGKVYKNKDVEIGWFAVNKTELDVAVYQLPHTQTFFHWHGETFGLPDNAYLLGTSQACKHQAFQIGKKTIGLQFHPEMTLEIVNDLIKYCGDELSNGMYVQDVATLQSVKNEQYLQNREIIFDILTYLNR